MARRAAKRAELFERRLNVNWEDLPLELKLLIVSHVPYTYFFGREMRMVNRQFNQDLVPDFAVWRRLYERVARDFLGAPEHHALERLDTAGQAIAAYYSCRDYWVTEAEQSIIAASLPEGENFPSLVLDLDRDGVHTLDSTARLSIILNRVGAQPNLPVRVSVNIGALTRSFLVSGDGSMEENPTLDPEAGYTNVVISRYHLLVNDQIVYGPIVWVLSGGRPTLFKATEANNLITVRQAVAKIGWNIYPQHIFRRNMAAVCGGYAIDQLFVTTTPPRPGTMNTTTPANPAEDPASVDFDIKTVRALLAPARARSSDQISRRNLLRAEQGQIDPVQVSRFLDVEITLRLIAITPDDLTQDDSPLIFTAWFAFDGPIRVISGRSYSGQVNGVDQWTTPLAVYDHEQPWPAGATPAAFVPIKLALGGVVETVQGRIFPDLGYSELGLPPGWFEAFKARTPWAAARTLGPLRHSTIASYWPVLGEIRLHQDGAITCLPIERHYLHKYDNWIELEEGKNPIATAIQQPR